MFFKPVMTIEEFLLIVEQLIQAEVRKLHPDGDMPKMIYRKEYDQERIMYCSSPRRKYHFAEVSISGAAEYYESRRISKHDVCTPMELSSVSLKLQLR